MLRFVWLDGSLVNEEMVGLVTPAFTNSILTLAAESSGNSLVILVAKVSFQETTKTSAAAFGSRVNESDLTQYFVPVPIIHVFISGLRSMYSSKYGPSDLGVPVSQEKEYLHSVYSIPSTE